LTYNHPALADAYTLLSWVDVTGQLAANILPSPNTYTVEITCDDAVLTSIGADGNYQVLWNETI
jgi:hypothetical protein